jgi:hypothetical protein
MKVTSVSGSTDVLSMSGGNVMVDLIVGQAAPRDEVNKTDMEVYGPRIKVHNVEARKHQIYGFNKLKMKFRY